MKFDCDSRRLRREAKREAEKAARLEWHPFFAILPVKVGPHDCRFLETVEERYVPVTKVVRGMELTWGHRIEYRARVGR
jgi:hypothetical protein